MYVYMCIYVIVLCKYDGFIYRLGRVKDYAIANKEIQYNNILSSKNSLS